MSETDANGLETKHAYDARNRLIETTDPDGGVTRFRYDNDNNLVAVTDPGSARSTFPTRTFATPGRFAPPDELFGGSLTRIDFEMTPDGRQLPSGEAITDQFASLGVTVGFVGNPGAGVTQIFSETATSAADPVSGVNGLATFGGPGGNESPVVEILFDAAVLSELPTSVGLVFVDSAPNNPFTVRAYGAAGTLIETVEIDTADSSFASTDNAEDTFIGFQHAAGVARLEYSTSFLTGSGITGFEIDDLYFGSPANGNTTRFTYDARDRLIRELDPHGSETRFTYDAVDNLIEQTDRNGRVTKFLYDDLDRLITETWLRPDDSVANTIDYAYDKVGNVLSVVDDFSSLAFIYDHRDRVKSVDNAGTLPGTGLPNVILNYTYDSVGNVLGVTEAIGGVAGATTAYLSDALNRLTSIQQSGAGVSEKVVDLVYNELGQFDEITHFSDLARAI